MEIERKFLVKDLPNLDDYSHKDIMQGYISLNPEVRIRKTNDKCYLTIKSEGTISREEKEIEINLATYLSLLKIIEGRIIYKTRYFIPLANSLTAELDVYHGYLEGLFTVEVEFLDLQEAQRFLPPSWFFKEITEDKKYKNKNLVSCDDIESLLTPKSDKKEKSLILYI